MEMPTPSDEHRWLQRLVGEWRFEGECNMGPDQPAMRNTGKETVRSLGGLWTIGEGEVGGPEGSAGCRSVMTLGYDPSKKRFIGSFIADAMTHQWTYEGSLDPSGKILTLDTVGPNFSGDGGMCKYQDIIEFVSDDQRTLSSQLQGPDGKWVPFMKAHYYRK